MNASIASIHRDHSRDLPLQSRSPIWTSRCHCSHIAATHGPADGWNLTGACLNARCDCPKFQAVAP